MCVCSGEVGSGKTTLVAKLQGVDEYMKGRGLEYLYFSVHDDDIDGNTDPASRAFDEESVFNSPCARVCFRPHPV